MCSSFHEYSFHDGLLWGWIPFFPIRLAEEKRRREELIAKLGAGSDASVQSGVKIFSDDEDDDEEDDDDDGDNDEEGDYGSGDNGRMARKISEASLRDQEVSSKISSGWIASYVSCCFPACLSRFPFTLLL